jgi:hypothetical protein
MAQRQVRDDEGPDIVGRRVYIAPGHGLTQLGITSGVVEAANPTFPGGPNEFRLRVEQDGRSIRAGSLIFLRADHLLVDDDEPPGGRPDGGGNEEAPGRPPD